MVKSCCYGAETSGGRESQEKQTYNEVLGIDKCYEKMKQVTGTESEGSQRELVFSWMVGEAPRN